MLNGERDDGLWQIRAPIVSRGRCRKAGSGRVRAAEKSFYRMTFECPYRKPTQVDGMSNARRSGEPPLRNSAKCIRNFGRRMDLGRLETGRVLDSQKSGPTDCLTKTQVSAKAQADV